MNNLYADRLIIGGNLLTASGGNLYVNNGLISGAGGDSVTFNGAGVTGISVTGSQYFTGSFAFSGIGNISLIVSGQNLIISNTSTGTTVDWTDILNKPTGFTPVGHGHTTGQISGLENYLAKVDTGNFLDTTKITTINGGFGNTILTGNGVVSSGGQTFVFTQGNGAGAFTYINGLTGQIILTGSAVSAAGNTFTFTQGSGTSSGVRVTGSSYITDSNFVGAGTTVVVQSGNNILISGINANTNSAVFPWGVSIISLISGYYSGNPVGIYNSTTSNVNPSFTMGPSFIATKNTYMTGARVYTRGVSDTGDITITLWNFNTKERIVSGVLTNVTSGVRDFSLTAPVSAGRMYILSRYSTTEVTTYGDVDYYTALGFPTVALKVWNDSCQFYYINNFINVEGFPTSTQATNYRMIEPLFSGIQY